MYYFLFIFTRTTLGTCVVAGNVAKPAKPVTLPSGCQVAVSPACNDGGYDACQKLGPGWRLGSYAKGHSLADYLLLQQLFAILDTNWYPTGNETDSCDFWQEGTPENRTVHLSSNLVQYFRNLRAYQTRNSTKWVNNLPQATLDNWDPYPLDVPGDATSPYDFMWALHTADIDKYFSGNTTIGRYASNAFDTVQLRLDACSYKGTHVPPPTAATGRRHRRSLLSGSNNPAVNRRDPAHISETIIEHKGVSQADMLAMADILKGGSRVWTSHNQSVFRLLNAAEFSKAHIGVARRRMQGGSNNEAALRFLFADGIAGVRCRKGVCSSPEKALDVVEIHSTSTPIMLADYFGISAVQDVANNLVYPNLPSLCMKCKFLSPACVVVLNVFPFCIRH